MFGCSNVACLTPLVRETHTESAFNTAHSVSILAQAGVKRMLDPQRLRELQLALAVLWATTLLLSHVSMPQESAISADHMW